MLKKEQVIMHIGLHKTGTTSIQQFLAENRTQLGDLDYVCYTRDGFFREDGNSYFLLKQHNWYSNKRSCQFDMPLLMENIKNSNKSRVMISSEAFSWCTGIENIKKLKDELLTVTDEILILVYVRDPVSFAVSVYTEGLKYPNSLSVLTDYTYPCLSKNNLCSQLSIEHYTFANLLPWKEVFLDNLKVRCLEDDKLFQNNLLADVLHVIGLNGNDKLKVKALSYRRENESFNMLQVYYLTLVIKFFNKFKDSHRLKSLSYELIRHKIHWLKSDKKFSVNDDVAKNYIDEIRNELFFSKERLGENINSEYYRGSNRLKRFSALDIIKIFFIFSVHVFLFGRYSLNRFLNK
tara:strand:- start:462 stop:1508 length:1047 start_codon:yes stop_codon:yes gene_type:complete